MLIDILYSFVQEKDPSTHTSAVSSIQFGPYWLRVDWSSKQNLVKGALHGCMIHWRRCTVTVDRDKPKKMPC